MEATLRRPAQACHHGGFSCYRAWALGPTGFRSFGSRVLEHRLNSCGTRAWMCQAMWDLPGLGIKPVSPALATKPPGNPALRSALKLGFHFLYSNSEEWPKGKEHNLMKHSQCSSTIFKFVINLTAEDGKGSLYMQEYKNKVQI